MLSSSMHFLLYLSVSFIESCSYTLIVLANVIMKIEIMCWIGVRISIHCIVC